MQTVIYADVLVFLNTVITFIILLSVKQFCGVYTAGPRLVIASFVGGLYSLIILAPEMNLLLTLLTKSSMAVSIILIAFHQKNLKLYLKCFVLFLLISCMYAGVMCAVNLFTHSSFITVNNGVVYYNVSVFSLIGICVCINAVLFILRKKVFNNREEDSVYDIELFYNDKRIELKALLDTGNSVRDPYLDQPVVIVTANKAEELTAHKPLNPLAKKQTEQPGGVPLRILPIRTLGNEALLPVFTANAVDIIGRDKVKHKTNISVAVTNDPLGGERYQALINLDLLS